MRRCKALIDGLVFTLHIPETEGEYHEGVRLLGGNLSEYDGVLFNFNFRSRLMFENSGVSQDLVVLFFDCLIRDSVGTVAEVVLLNKGSSEARSSEGMYAVAVELRKDTCDSNSIGRGSIITVQEEF